jgi:hypothetical protein
MRYKRIIPFLKEKGVRHIFIDTDGDFNILIPKFMECGAEGLNYFFSDELSFNIQGTSLKMPLEENELQLFFDFNKHLYFLQVFVILYVRIQ